MDETKAAETSKALPKGLTQEAVDGFKRQWSELRVIGYGEVGLLVRQPSPGEWERFQEKIDDAPKNQYRAMHELLQCCIVWPDSRAVSEVFAKRPAWVKRFGMALVGFAAGEEGTEKNDL